MKKQLIFLLSVLSISLPALSLATTSSNLRDVRETFKNSKAPRVSDIKDQSFHCIDYKLINGQFESEDVGKLKIETFYGDESQYILDSPATWLHTRLLKLGDSELYIEKRFQQQNNVAVSIRANTERRLLREVLRSLVIERAQLDSDIKLRALSSNAIDGMMVESYMECQPL